MNYRKHEISDTYLYKWQKTLDMIAGLYEVPAALIMRVSSNEIEVLVSSHSNENPYKAGEKTSLDTGLYCETVMAEKSQLLVPNALMDDKWKNNPDVNIDMISYLGVPLVWPDDEIFGTLCVLDRKTRNFSEHYQSLLWEMKRIIETDFVEYTSNNEKLTVLSIALEQSPYSVVITDPKGTIEYVNEKFCTITGFSEEEVLGKKPNIMSSGKTSDEIYQKLWNTVLSGKEWHGEFENRKKNGDLYWEDVTITPVFDNNGEIFKIMALKEDITEQKFAQNNLKIALARNEALLNAIPDMMFLIDENFKIVDYHSNQPDSLYVKPEEFLNRKLDDFFPPHLVLNTKKKVSKVLLTGNPDTFNYNLEMNGSKKYFESRYVLCGDHQVLSIVRDISKRGEAEEEKKKLQNQLAQSQKMDAIGQLAGGMAHDFNNVLSGIMSAAQLLQSPKRNLGDKNLKYVDMIMKASINAADLTKKLLLFSRKKVTHSSIVDVKQIIRDIVDILKRTIDKKITIITEFENCALTIRGEASTIQNALLNMGINSSQAMPNGGEIRIICKKTLLDKAACNASLFDLEPGNFVEIEISDTGNGISQENLKKIFEPFYTTKEQGQGTGLGLSAVYGAIQEHQGEIRVQSKIDSGTLFTIFLPFSKKLKKDKKDVEELITGRGTILLVDDEELNRILGKEILESLGYKVLLAVNGRNSVEIFKEKSSHIDMVIMDMIMPEMNGSEAFVKMKEIDENCKVIISSGFTKNENINKLLELGLVGVINKPYRISELSQLLDETMNTGK